MPRFLVRYVQIVETINRTFGRVAMYLLFVMMGIMVWSMITKFAHIPALWTLEMAQFTLVAYYMLGAPWTMQSEVNVRMDLIYARFSHKGRALTDALTVFFLMTYLGIMLYGAFDSTVYSYTYNERNPTAWRPVLWPLKSIITFSFALMLLQATALLIRDIATLRGEKI
ncbi:TRAP-type mannitol/chloroaromatic compound transport system permease small subunit [Rhodobacter aestuarii]|uniref:TRAP transporter small permease protein n=1 Tax=Rhodobacter aestuarii TaxID=453582 RepID=A0A1N7PAL4_9RHOB|nr:MULTISPECIES: TRAP transporter small permease subunit [Rhodobacter]PTV97704.1 TRAP-type mannitol/chloroaromatic compound transport system permease small subunit [Rhodobacter aestuarii]SIT07580.1 TRAP-type mannitol/chloroaromatic compound transport system, small permease component [Rhodobacter aestuarii]SOC04640.1 TRAP-type mannitol/chloroaromatic compound transport system permease small subunit [Rhodobacter sp. JA431]